MFITADQFDAGAPAVNLAVSGGQPSADGNTEYLHWPSVDLRVGDEVLVRVVEETPDPPAERQVYEKETELAGYRRNLRVACEWLTDEERRALIRELVTELRADELGGAPDPRRLSGTGE